MTPHASPSPETIAAQEREIRKLADAGDAMAIAQVQAWERAATVEPTSGMSSIAGLLPKAAEIAIAAFRRVRPKLWAIESDRFNPRREFDLDAWRKAFRRSRDAREGCAGAVTYNYAVPVIDVLYELARTGKGHAVETMDRIAEIAHCCPETVRKVIRDAEIDGFLDTWNRTDRPTKGKLKGMVVRVANLYVPIMPADDYRDAVAAAKGSAESMLPDDGTVPPAQAWLARVARQIKRGEQFFRLYGRKLGLNLTPLARAAPA